MVYIDITQIRRLDRLSREISHVSAGLAPRVDELKILLKTNQYTKEHCFNAEIGGARCRKYNRRHCVWSCSRKVF